MVGDLKSTMRGPFCVFPNIVRKSDRCAFVPVLEPTVANQGNSVHDDQRPQMDKDIEEAELGPQSLDTLSPTNAGWDAILSASMPVDLESDDVVDIPMDECEYLDNPDSLSAAKGSTLMISSQSSHRPNFRHTATLPMDRISISLSNNPLVDLLMHHYIVNVSDLLLPVRHSRNPYRNIYAPAALEVASGLKPTSGVNVALYHSLLASSAFHLWHCNPGLLDFYQIGTEYNERAVHYLRSSISDTTVSATDYRSLLMTILSLVDNSIMSGGQTDSVVHVKGATQFRKSQDRRLSAGHNTQQLNEISAFFSLIESTTSLQSDPSPWLNEGHCFFHGELEPEYVAPLPGYCFEYQFGITPTIATAIQETCRLADHLTFYSNVKEPVPSGLLEACETLDQTLLSWTLEIETETYISSRDTELLSIFVHQANAWHRAALIYNSRRIHHRSREDLADEVAQVAQHMHAIEDVKVTSNADMASRGAPMTWPAFVASCDALSSKRDIWRHWWERVQCYHIANYSRQWEVVQKVWEARDLETIGKSADWIDILRDLNIQVFLL
ncbi:hypothetical protein E6O75_ATG05686 [Venturia nashicola]|uniref:Uncharacterized protein n=1 Tax=Venturia nashicola TaxID=86259 RepID=A0A4Z1P8R3_9PEZI|nr:hypothetical protein E6O75_ATG05686 [Venturia nashicola]